MKFKFTFSLISTRKINLDQTSTKKVKELTHKTEKGFSFSAFHSLTDIMDMSTYTYWCQGKNSLSLSINVRALSTVASPGCSTQVPLLTWTH